MEELFGRALYLGLASGVGYCIYSFIVSMGVHANAELVALFTARIG